MWADLKLKENEVDGGERRQAAEDLESASIFPHLFRG
jgi:hypothetical protein